MPTKILEEIELIIEDIGGGGGKQPPSGGDDDGSRPRRRQPFSPRRYRTGIALGLAAILVFFLTLASAFFLRRMGGDWAAVRLPRVIWFNTFVLLASSWTLESARRRLRAGDLRGFKALWRATTALGLLFLAGQLFAWWQLAAQGVFVGTNPASSFFYIFTAAHALHLLGGVVALLYVLLRAFESAKLSRAVAAEVTSYYWHFMDGLWLFLLLLLCVGK